MARYHSGTPVRQIAEEEGKSCSRIRQFIRHDRVECEMQAVQTADSAGSGARGIARELRYFRVMCYLAWARMPAGLRREVLGRIRPMA